jgi:tetratricopeptide (TPR) repeat protein
LAALHQQGRHHQARRLFDQALRCARQIGERRTEALALLALGELDLHQHHYPLAEQRLDEAYGIFGQFGSVTWQVRASAMLNRIRTGSAELDVLPQKVVEIA